MEYLLKVYFEFPIYKNVTGATKKKFDTFHEVIMIGG